MTLRRMTLNILFLSLVLTGLSFLDVTNAQANQPVSHKPDTLYNVGCTSKKRPVDFSRLVRKASHRQGVTGRMLATTVYRESGCDPTVTGQDGDAGLGQIVPRVWLKTLIKNGLVRTQGDLYDPWMNLNSTAWILSRIQDRVPSGDMHTVFKRYNGAGKRASKYAREQVVAYHRVWGDM